MNLAALTGSQRIVLTEAEMVVMRSHDDILPSEGGLAVWQLSNHVGSFSVDTFNIHRQGQS
jgi:hypothetical protein